MTGAASGPRPLWTAEALRAATDGAMAVPFDATGISIDSRTLRPGDLFIALIGDHGDGHAHVADALARGAAGAMVHAEPAGFSDRSARLLTVGDTLQGLRALAAAGRSRFRGRLAAVTGSVGKTTTKEMLRAILAAQGPTHAAEASHNNHWGVPLTLARLPPAAAWGVVEIGMNHAGEIAPLARLARPHVAVITTIGTAHIGQLGSQEAIADEKASLLAALEPDGIAVLPADATFFPRLAAAAGAHAVCGFGIADAAAARLLDCRPDGAGSDVAMLVAGRELRFPLPVPGLHMAMNALSALAAAVALGADPLRSAAALAGFAAMPGRGARQPILGGRAMLLDESYNASTTSVRAALAVLRDTGAARRLAVLGDMLELGAHAVAEHEALAPDVAAAADLLYACGPLTRHLFAALPERQRGAHAPDSAMLAPLVAAAVRPGDAVLVKGSLGSRMRVVVQALESCA